MNKTNIALHLTASGWVCALLAFVTFLQEGNYTNYDLFGSITVGAIASIVLYFIISVVVIGFNWKNMLATIIGAASIYGAAGLGVLFNNLSN